MKTNQNRHGAILPMFAIVLPVMLILSFIAINLSYMQLTQTELKIGTDAAARAGGRAWSGSQDIDISRDVARQAAELNMVSGRPLVLSTNEVDGQIVFGESIRAVDGGRYQFSQLDDATVESGVGASGLQVSVVHPTNLLFKVANISSFNPAALSISTQVDRDMALIIDRSQSMVYFRDNAELRAVVADLLSAGLINEGEARKARLYRSFSPAVLQHLSGEMLEFANSLNATFAVGKGAPILSRWSMLENAIEAFFRIVKNTDQIEQVSVSSFAREAQLDLQLTRDMNLAENTIKSLSPRGSTVIGDGLLTGITTLNTDLARPSAVKSIILFTDGITNGGTDPVVAAQRVIANNPDVIIHTITLSLDADQETMQTVAEAANGKHFHADTEEQLIKIFEEIALTLPTIITQ